MFYLIQLLLQSLEILFIVPRDVWNRVLAGQHPMFLMRCAAIDTVDTEQLELVLTVESDEIIVEETLLRHLVFVGNAVEVQTGTEVVLSALKGFDVICVILLQKD